MPIERPLPQKAQRIIRWRETISTLDDRQFFDLMRVYIGEIHTPYNKDKLIEQLSSIFRKEQNLQTIFSYLSKDDVKILTLISIIQKPTQETIEEFFSTEFKISYIYSLLLNLKERLLIYSYFDTEIQKTVFDINPIISEKLELHLDVNCLFFEDEFAEHNFSEPKTISPLVIAAFISYIYENPDLCKNNLELKKRNSEQLQQLFNLPESFFNKLLLAFFNLGILKQGEKDFLIDNVVLNAFAALSEQEQYCFLASASLLRLSRPTLQNQTQLLLNTLNSILADGFSKTNILRTAFLLANKNQTEVNKSTGRFAQIVNSYNERTFSQLAETRILRTNQNSFQNISTKIIESSIEGSISFGLLQEIGKTIDGISIYKKSSIFEKDFSSFVAEKKGILNINASTNITILPGLTLKELIPLMQFLEIKNVSTVAEFEISKKSVSKAFAKNISVEQIIQKLSEFSAYKIPQSLQMNLEEWHNSYSSAILYYGYVLKVDQKTERFFENNTNAVQFITQKLAPGVFLLNIPVTESPEQFIAQSGLTFVGNVVSSKSQAEQFSFPVLHNPESFFENANKQEKQPFDFLQNEQNAATIKNQFKEIVENSSMTDQQKECLLMRINQNVIILPEQLNPQTVKLEILEADGINYSAKIHLLQNAQEHKNLIEFTIPDEQNLSSVKEFVGTPVLLIKEETGYLVKVALRNSEETTIFPVSRMTHVKILKTSIFS